MKQRLGIKEHWPGPRLVVLPSVWAVAEKKPCASVGAGAGEKKANAGVSPLRGSAASVEMTVVEKEKATVVEVAFYRKYTEAMLRRYAVMSMEAGRVPSMLGREMFRGKVTNYRVHSFDDVVIFCHDVESCLKRLSPEEQKVIKRVAVQQYTHGEAAMMLGLSLRTCIRHYGDAVDRLTRIFLKVNLLEPLKACQ